MADTEPPLITIVVPLYNKAPYVARALRSVLSQRFRNFELIVVDDGSTDGSGEIARGIADPRIRVLEQPNQGPGLARNRGWRAGTGSLVAFLDADDWWFPDYLEHAVKVLGADADIAACTSGHRTRAASGAERDPREHWLKRGLREGKFLATARTPTAEFLAVLTYLFPVTTVVRRPVLEQFGGFFDAERCTYGEDSYLWLRVLLRHAVHLDLEPRMCVDEGAAGLSHLGTLASRPLEPVLKHPDDVRAVCPAPLRPLLESLLATKAAKRACALAAVGRWREGAALREKFAAGRAGVPWGLDTLATVATQPWGAPLARAGLVGLRWLRGDVRAHAATVDDEARR
ncbi:MAG: glycosyltransferase family 2 protein [Proteobacteria bacterium]|nr:glycosyltransferase family 2 protein [Pseudomonadota bacterium]